MKKSITLGKKELAHLSDVGVPDLIEICMDHLNDAILITAADTIDDPGPRIIWANKSFYKQNGYTPEEIVGQTPRILQGPQTSRSKLDEVRAALLN